MDTKLNGEKGSDSQQSTINHQLAGNGDAMPNSRRVYVAGVLHPDIHVPFREINLAPTKTMSGEIEVNEPVRVYDTSGPWTDANVDLDVTRGLPSLRQDWILKRADVEEIDGRKIQPIDDGYLSETHAAHASSKRSTHNVQRPTSNGSNGNLQSEIFNLKSRRPLRAKSGSCVTQLAYARRGIITPEMEFIAIREIGNSDVRHPTSDVRNDLRQQHTGESF